MTSSPIVTCSVVDTNPATIALTGFTGLLVRHFSTAKATMQAQDGAVLNLDACIIRNGSNTAYGVEGTFANVSSDTFNFFAESSDGRFYDASIPYPMVEYIKLTCNPSYEGKGNRSL